MFRSRNLRGLEVRIVQEEDPEEGNHRIAAGEGSHPGEDRSYREEGRSCIENRVRINCKVL